MAYYLISYDLHRDRDYTRLYEALATLRATPLHQSLWMAELRGPAVTIRDLLSAYVDHDDSLAVIEIDPLAEWATMRASNAANAWLLGHVPFHDRAAA